jgi:uncharacterized protein YkwD
MEAYSEKKFIVSLTVGCVFCWSMVGVYLKQTYEGAMKENATFGSSVALGKTQSAEPAGAGTASQLKAAATAPQTKALPAVSGDTMDESPATEQEDILVYVSSLPGTETTCVQADFDTQFLCILNSYRRANGKESLAYDDKLSLVALRHSQWMQSSGIFSHTGEGGSRFDERCKMAGAVCYAENIAYGFTSAGELFEMWRESPGHDANMLGDHTRMGLGIAGGYAANNFR